MHRFELGRNETMGSHGIREAYWERDRDESGVKGTMAPLSDLVSLYRVY